MGAGILSWRCRKTRCRDAGRALRRKQPAVVSSIRCADGAVFCDLGTQQIYQVLIALMAADVRASKDGPIKEMVRHFFRGLIFAVALVNGSRFLQPIL